MNIFVYIDGKQQGPFGVSDIERMNLDPNTLVWHQGLPEWQKACQTDAISHIFAGQARPEPAPATDFGQAPETNFGQSPETNFGGQEPYQQPVFEQQQPAQQPYNPQQPMAEQAYAEPGYDGQEPPSNYRGLSIALMVSGFLCCCPGFIPMVLGIIAFVMGGKVNTAMQVGDIEYARQKSGTAKILVYVGLGWMILNLLGLVAYWIVIFATNSF